MNRSQHLDGAIVILIVVGFVLSYLGFFSYVIYSMTLFVGAILPDVLEPARHFTHRRYFHSKRILKKAYLGVAITLVLGLIFGWFFYIFFFLIGYIIHLWMDSTTKMGLPN